MKASFSQASLVPLSGCKDERAGGKALGLAKLIECGLPVPAGFVVLGGETLPVEFAAAYAALGGKVAVRSSALGEDGDEVSFAGQFDTFLDVEGVDAVRAAVERCRASARHRRARAYQCDLQTAEAESMAVVVQKMVRAQAAGVIFTVDPVTGHRDRLVLEATRGRGDELVSGRVAADRFVLTRDCRIVSCQLVGGTACLTWAAIERLARAALYAEAQLGYPLDLEWAVDDEGVVQWLQARPITTLDLPGLDELDEPQVARPEQLFTTYNVSEVLPGAVTPLFWSTAGPAMDMAARELFVRYGVPRQALAGQVMLACFSGHLFLNMTPSYTLTSYVLGASKEAADYSIAGHRLPEVPIDPAAPLPVRIANGVRFVATLLKARARAEEHARRTANFKIEATADPVRLYRNINAALQVVGRACEVHLRTSSLSDALHGVLLAVLRGGQSRTPEHDSAAAALLAQIGNRGGDVAGSSLALPQAFERVVAAIAAQPESLARFRTLGPAAALAWLQEGADPSVRAAFADLLRDHGHRCVNEYELRQPSWQEDPRPLVTSLQRAACAVRRPGAPRPFDAADIIAALPKLRRWAVTWLAKKTCDAVVLRERSKSQLVRILRQLRGSYLRLGALLVEAGRLPDADAVFFFTHPELGELCEAGQPRLVRRALHRRRLQPQKAALQFPPVSLGKPQPLPVDHSFPEDEADALHGTPVSRGVAIGRARVARTLEEADAIEPGEILVVPFTDVGWVPCFVRAAGLATEIGGTLSHGAVVAREYGLPAVVNLAGATRHFRTGQLVRLDGLTGELRRIGPSEPPAEPLRDRASTQWS